jgi:hypothetical protein
MTKDEIIEMAKEAGFDIDLPAYENGTALAIKLAKLVAAKEREACAKLLDEEAIDAFTFDDSLARATENYAELIRARGEA